jgi:hypothetical protein
VSEEDKKRMATKKYPNMMSPEGSFSYWFFHNKSIHLWITLVRTPPVPPILLANAIHRASSFLSP